MNRRDGIVEFLKCITQFMHAEGGILWGEFKHELNEDRSLFTLAQWFNNSNPHALHNIKFDKSLAGKAIEADERLCMSETSTLQISNIMSHARVC